ncbi:hypothetical protein AB0D57_44595 [Streptomyces sp. NPDC048275]|uniref:hypothetical protein n=1 Tax=Streptomyces sp. NPDC048275 TaxID=3155629 RepID=UPI0033C6D0F8
MKTRKPPAKAAFKDASVRELVAKAAESAPVIGIGASGKPLSVDLDAGSPHILGNASAGGGKSVTLRCITCQMLHNGSQAYILDYKRISHPWARGIPGVTYCADIADIHDALIELGMEGRRRVRVADELGIDADPDAVGPRLLILLEEVNATMKQLARYWERTRESGDPKVSPAIDALNEVLYMGRMHVLLVAQSATARALGGPEVREQFATRILARYSLNAWRMLAPEVHQTPGPRPGLPTAPRALGLTWPTQDRFRSANHPGATADLNRPRPVGVTWKLFHRSRIRARVVVAGRAIPESGKRNPVLGEVLAPECDAQIYCE